MSEVQSSFVTVRIYLHNGMKSYTANCELFNSNVTSTELDRWKVVLYFDTQLWADWALHSVCTMLISQVNWTVSTR